MESSRASTSVSQKIVTIPAGTEETLALCFEPDDDGQSTLTIHVEHGATLTLFEALEGGGSSWLHNCRITLDAEASFTWNCLQAVRAETSLTHHQTIALAEGASLHLKNFTFGGAHVEQSVMSAIAGKNATSTIEWAAYARGKERMTLSAKNTFAAENGGGEIVMKAVAEEQAHIACKGMIEIGAKGSGTQTYLTQNVLMLDTSAKVDAVPGLEIKTNDVKASHSASIARVTPEDLFYFASRGIPKREARQLFVNGFLGSLAETIRNDDQREEVLGSLLKKMEGGATS